MGEAAADDEDLLDVGLRDDAGLHPRAHQRPERPRHAADRAGRQAGLLEQRERALLPDQRLLGEQDGAAGTEVVAGLTADPV